MVTTEEPIATPKRIKPSRLIRAIDVASYQPRDLTALIQQYQPEHVVVKLYLRRENISQDHSRAQIASAKGNGCSIGGYVFLYRDFNPAWSVREAVTLARACGVKLPVLWLDCETYEGIGPGPEAVQEAVLTCFDLGVHPGIYTGKWYWQEYMNNTNEFSHLPLWLAQYDGAPSLDNVELFGGWESPRVWGKQYSSDGVDQNVFIENATI